MLAFESSIISPNIHRQGSENSQNFGTRRGAIAPITPLWIRLDPEAVAQMFDGWLKGF